jgi:hypothetical protein
LTRPGEQPIDVLVDGAEQTWTLAHARDAMDQRLTLTAPTRSWTVRAHDLFEALRELRRQLEPEAISVCCQGARPNAWSSSMQRDMGVGHHTYLTEIGLAGRPPQTQTLAPAPCAEVGTVAEQDAFHARWMASR